MHTQAKLLDLGVDTAATGKTLDSLALSRDSRDDILRKFRGELPMSIMQAEKRTRGADDLATGSYAATSSVKDKHTQVAASVFDVSGQGCAGGALSVFPQNVGRAMLLLYAPVGSLVVDPFAGHNSRMQLCVENGYHYIGCDICEEFMTFNRAKAENLRGQYPAQRVSLHLCDSRKMLPVADACGDFTITSPPYYDREYYGPEHEQLGFSQTYQQFLNGMAQVAQANFRALKRGAFAVWFVNDFRRNGKFHVYHADTLDLLESAGFVANDICIVDLGYPIRAAFATQVVEQKILPKRHEYALVMRKP
jgi:hypothetical protein